MSLRPEWLAKPVLAWAKPSLWKDLTFGIAGSSLRDWFGKARPVTRARVATEQTGSSR